MGTRRLRASFTRAAIAALTVLSLAAGVAASDSLRLRTDLRGTNENPDADLDGRGKATIRIDDDANLVCFDISFDRIGTPNRGHIHIGGPEQNGGIVVDFFNLHEGATKPEQVTDPRNDEMERRERTSGCVTATQETIDAIEANPGGYYVNLHNSRFPAGVIRGQLGVSGGDDD